MNDRQLFCTFTTKSTLDLTIDYLDSFFEVSNGQMFLYAEEDKYYNKLLIYNVDASPNGIARNTIPVHRKKQFNTFYTINALNNLISRINNGVLDITYQIDWDNYENVLLTGKNEELFITEIVFEKKIII